ncbi:hypothetical protein KR054_003251 [Drosophila jambulina]|nr:hypothetical protein KR054_003251 [Drosophila jambulina]
MNSQAEPVKKQEQVVEPEPEAERLVATKRSHRPRLLRPSAIRRICRLPAEGCKAKAEAKVMYFNSKFGKCSLSVCHEDICPYTEVCKKHQNLKRPKPSIAMMQRISRIVRKSFRNSAMPRGKLNSQISKKANKSPKTPSIPIPRSPL